LFAGATALLAVTLPAPTTPTKSQKTAATKKARKTASKAPATAAKKTTKKAAPKRYSPWSEPTYADSTVGDVTAGEDAAVRQAAVAALGRYNGSIVSVDPNTGRILAMVNQKVALKSGFQPCSTIKLPVAIAALVEGLIDRATVVRTSTGKRLTLTDALAHSDNAFFASLGMKLGFDRFSYYARLLGLGEKAGLNIKGEQQGAFPANPTASGVGMMSSFGEGISLTPLQLAAMLSSFANGGTLYYLQYPRSEEELQAFTPRVKRHVDLERWLPEIKPGMTAAVEYGTARRANYDPSEPVLGKTGTCTDNRTHLGWFGSFNDVGRNKLVVVVLLTGGSGVSGPTAAQVAGNMYRRLSEGKFFAQNRQFSPATLVSTQSCCVR
jgi:cell division protein FtsI/penicillin-binding protein 2